MAPDAKETARSQVVEEIQAGGYGHREIIVRCEPPPTPPDPRHPPEVHQGCVVDRVNGLQTEWFEEDVAAAARSGADAVLLPKTEAASDVSHLQDLLHQHGAPNGMEVWCMVETPLGVLRVADICDELQLRAAQGAFRRPPPPPPSR